MKVFDKIQPSESKIIKFNLIERFSDVRSGAAESPKIGVGQRDAF
jgi:hypothetical protein